MPAYSSSSAQVSDFEVRLEHASRWIILFHRFLQLIKRRVHFPSVQNVLHDHISNTLIDTTPCLEPLARLHANLFQNVFHVRRDKRAQRSGCMQFDRGTDHLMAKEVNESSVQAKEKTFTY